MVSYSGPQTIEFVPEGDSFTQQSSNWSTTADSSGNTAPVWRPSYTNTASTSSSTNPLAPSAGGGTSGQAVADGGCNESLKHTNAEKAVFHATKGAKRMLDEGQHTEALRIAGAAGTSYLASMNLEYDADRSATHLAEKVLDRLFGNNRADEIEAGIEKAFDKIDRGNHKGGARVAIATADEFLEDFEAP